MIQSPFPQPQAREFSGRHVRLSPLVPATDAAALFTSSHDPATAEALWRYMPAGPFVDAAAMQKWLEQRDADPAAVAFTVRSMPTDEVIGSIAIIRITPEHGVAELGYIWYAPAAQRTAANTEAVYLLLNYLLGELRYRRVEWKCDAANLRSRHAALRLGFQHEGIFRQHMIRKGHNRDTAWFSLLDKEWPLTAVALECWLAGDQSVSLAALKPVN